MNIDLKCITCRDVIKKNIGFPPYTFCSIECENEKVKMIKKEFRIDLKDSLNYTRVFKELIIHQDGIRYEQRQPPIWMQINITNKKCWCGKPFKWPRRKYCSDKHSSWWWWHINAYWGSFRTEIIRADNFTCQGCGFKTKHNLDGEAMFDVDHTKAISLGGACYDVSNVRSLCEKCHKKKTKEDMKKLSFYRKAEGYQPFEVVT